MKVYADREVCIGAGLCTLRLPQVFDQSDDDGTVVLLRTEPDPSEESAVRQAVDACPSSALWVEGVTR